MFSRLLSQSGNSVRAAVLLACYLAMLAGGLFGPTALFAVAAAGALLMELYIVGWSPSTEGLLEKHGVRRVYRHLLRDLSVVLLIVRTVEMTPAQTSLVLVLPATVWAVAVTTGVLMALTERMHPVPALTRNIDTGTHRPPPRAPWWVERFTRDRLPYVNIVLIPGALAAAAAGTLTPYVVAAVLALAAGAPIAAVLAGNLVRGRTIGWTPVMRTVERWLRAHRPQVVVYFAGPAKDVYQVNMWLEPLEALGRTALVVLRSREAFRALAPTTVPVVCIRSSVEYMNLPFDSVRAALYPANVGANIHMLREPGMTHVFVGHGDSDKQASVNPYSKVYDEVWVAGPAGRERYANAGVGVLDSDIVEIGRPQLAALQVASTPVADRPFTVLYAPTWEGWIDEERYHTSLVLMGESIVRALLELDPPVRVIYKPHPLTGTRSRHAAEAHDRLVQLVHAAGGRTAGVTSLDGSSHLVVTDATPGLFDCFNASDLLVSDVSGVLADFVQTQRPYVVANPGALPEDEFRRAYPTSRGAYLLAEGGELEKIVHLSRTGDDPMREARRELKSYLLGPDEPSSIERFRAEIARLCDAGS